MTRGRSTTSLVHLATFVLIVAALYFGKPVLMPVALATLFTFLLNPVVSAVCRTGLHLSISVVLVVLLGFSILGAMIWGFGSQMTSLVAELPDYKQNIREKIQDLKSAGSGSSLDRLRQTWRELRGEIHTLSPGSSTNKTETAVEKPRPVPGLTNPAASPPPPVSVVVRGQPGEGFWMIPTALGPVTEVAATAAFVIILVIFMLLRGRDLRNRLIIFIGHNRIPATTRALDEAAERISRYLLMQTIINGSYGFAVGLALSIIGLPYALMWGFLAALLRFIPYIGPWLGAAMPILLSLAVFPGWLYPLLVLGLVLIFELVSNMIMEPMLYGSTVGVSEVALIVAVAFWTWLWGPIGLVLATPLTVCLVVLGKYVPSLSFVPLLMGDEPVMSPPVQFYQRLLATDELEATGIAREFHGKNNLIELYDQLLVPALVSAKQDYKNHELSDEHLEFIVETTEKLINRFGPSTAARTGVPAVTVLGVPVEDTIDELIMQMLSQVLPDSVCMQVISSQTLSGELMEELDRKEPSLICIGAALSVGTGSMRYLSKRLRARFPTVPILLARWGLANPKRQEELATATGVQNVATNLTEARKFLIHMAQLDLSSRGDPRLLQPASQN